MSNIVRVINEAVNHQNLEINQAILMLLISKTKRIARKYTEVLDRYGLRYDWNDDLHRFRIIGPTGRYVTYRQQHGWRDTELIGTKTARMKDRESHPPYLYNEPDTLENIEKIDFYSALTKIGDPTLKIKTPYGIRPYTDEYGKEGEHHDRLNPATTLDRNRLQLAGLKTSKKMISPYYGGKTDSEIVQEIKDRTGFEVTTSHTFNNGEKPRHRLIKVKK
jgi:hypothetical protein